MLLRFMESEEELVIVDFGFRQQWAFAAVMPKRVGKKLGKYFLQKLRINVQHRVATLNLPGDLVFLFWEILVDLFAQVFDEIWSPIRDKAGFNVPDVSGKLNSSH